MKLSISVSLVACYNLPVSWWFCFRLKFLNLVMIDKSQINIWILETLLQCQDHQQPDQHQDETIRTQGGMGSQETRRSGEKTRRPWEPPADHETARRWDHENPGGNGQPRDQEKRREDKETMRATRRKREKMASYGQCWLYLTLISSKYLFRFYYS